MQPKQSINTYFIITQCLTCIFKQYHIITSLIIAFHFYFPQIVMRDNNYKENLANKFTGS